ncbi:SDR family NAD(P)-dependent oxidoreductase [Conexibacter sp. CPCC 206217]|uniref:SDR family NAD(P)-dependent oxidoreductase n=1 Tax=Conexibacter sp. CPCC 206217 TaxID=3064574 RepID=UPI0027284BE0|nr:SDR family oxidoreductase [Conexibacter sp. CPCC 206217]MDO8211702.1 SDR family oxidoreductase [Conexibacter sp. CPCC 206217]
MAYLEELFELPGRVALVTGARQGVGRALALALARAGARVALTSRDAASLRELGRELEPLGAEPLLLGLELTDAAAPARAVEAVIERWGRLDVLVNNAGLSIRGPAVDYAVAEWDEVFATNLRGPFLLAQAAARAMGDGGRIVNVSSTYARVAVAERAAYAASKAGLEQLTRALAVEWAARGITVNAIAPGATPTQTRRAVLGTAEAARARAAEIPLGRLGSADDLAGALLLLTGPAGAFITGQTIVVDGGYTLGVA